MNVKLVRNDNISNGYSKKVNDQNQNKKHKNRYFVGQDNTEDTKSLVNEKRTKARQKARKLIDSAWKTENKVSDGIDSMRSEHTNALKDIKFSSDMLKDIENTKEQLRKEYGVELDSQEQKDLELLQKKQDSKNKLDVDGFTNEEMDRLKELEGTPLTEYQKAVLELNDTAREYKDVVSKGDTTLQNITGSISQAKIEQLKLRAVQKANKAAEQVIEAASDEITGMLRQEAVDKVEETQQEEKEKAEKKEEEQQAKEEQLDKIEEKNKENEKTIQDVQEEIKKIKKQNNLTDDDLKGIDIDYMF